MPEMHTAQSLFTEFRRKGSNAQVSHYCPGCGHGIVHKLVAEAISDLGVQDRTVFLSPVGCSVFGYYYFDTGNIQCAHGRAPAVGTGVRRSHQDSIVISYQGDGDLAGIGTAEIVHAANRGENMTVIFVNNAIYGMTGGQMAPTTTIDQKTATTPLGRDYARDGMPIRMSEMLSQLEAPAYIERVSLADPGRIRKARRAIKKAVQNQVEGKGFSMVEVLSQCPVGWKMSAPEATQWIRETMEEVFPPGVYKDRSESLPKTEPIPRASDDELLELLGISREEREIQPQPVAHDQLVRIAGFGGQGVMSAGVLLANCAIESGINATWLPSYGPEMRGGTANASVVISNEPIGSPVVTEPNVLIAMNLPSLDGFEDTVMPGGLVIANSSMIPRGLLRDDIRAYLVPATDMAKDAGFIKGANVILLTIYLAASNAINVETLRQMMPRSLKRKSATDINLKMIELGLEWYRTNG